MACWVKPLIGSVRVSSAQQGRSGLGLAAQKEALERFAAAEGFALGRIFVEAETARALTLSIGVRSLRQR